LAKLANFARNAGGEKPGAVVDITNPQRREKLLKAVSVNEVGGRSASTEHLDGSIQP